MNKLTNSIKLATKVILVHMMLTGCNAQASYKNWLSVKATTEDIAQGIDKELRNIYLIKE